MRRNAHIERLLDDARHNQRCAYGSTRNERAAFNNRARHGDLLCMFPNLTMCRIGFRSSGNWRRQASPMPRTASGGRDRIPLR